MPVIIQQITSYKPADTMKKTRTYSIIFPIIIMLLLLASSSLHAQSSGTFTINPAGGGDFLTLQEAVDDLASEGMDGPVILEFSSGNHIVDEVVVGYVDGMSEDNTLTIRSQSNNAEDVTLEHLTIRNSDGFTVVEVHGAVAGIRIADNRLFGLPTTANQQTRSLVRAYDIEGAGLYIERNLLEENSLGIYAQSASSGNPFRDLHIDGNRIGNVRSGNILINMESAQFINNRVQVNINDALQLNSPRGDMSFVANNVLISDVSTVVRTVGSPVQPVRFYHNTIVGLGGGLGNEVIRVTQTAHDIRNNIIFSAGPGRAVFDSNTGSQWSHNSLYTTGPYLGQFGASNNPDNIGFTLADLAAKTGNHQNSFGLFPALDPENDYRSNSPLLDQAGDDLSAIVATDIDGNPRSSTPSIGAFEYGSTVTPFGGGTYTVGSGGDFSSPAAMIDAINERGMTGDVTFTILPGAYAVGRSLHVVPPATGEERVTIRSQSGNPEDVTFEGVDDVEYVLELNGARFVTIEHITLDARELTTTSRHALGMNGGVADITIRGNRFIGEDGASNQNRNLITGTEVRQSNYLFEDNAFEGGYYALRLNTHAGGSLIAENIVFRRNRVGGLGGVNIQSFDGAVIEKNVIHADRAVRIDHSNRTPQAAEAEIRSLIANNQITSRTVGSNVAYGIWVRTSEAVDVLHNTVRILKNNASEGGVDINNSSDVDFANNIIVVETPTAANPVYRIVGNTSDLRSDHNHFFGLMDNKFRDGSTNYTTLEDFQNGTGLDAASTFGSVNFASDEDLIPSGASANDPDLTGSGKFLTIVPDDIRDLLRSDPPNKGAHEVDGEQPNFSPFFTSVPEDQPIGESETFQFHFEAEDPDGDALTFSLTQGDDVDNASITASGLFSFNPDFGQTGSFNFTMRVSDGELFVEHYFAITVGEPESAPFITIWQSDNEGASADNEITIPTRSGETYNYNVYWEDVNDASINGTETEVTGNITLVFPNPGTYRVEIRGEFPHIFFNDNGDKEKILSIEQWGEIAWSSMERAFQGTSNLVINANDIPDLSSVTNAERMFQGATVMNSDLNNWDVSNIQWMNSMFRNTEQFNGNISGWNVTGAIDMQRMFRNAAAFDQDLNDWQTENVENMERMFQDAVSFNGNISTWDVSSVTEMFGMFWGASSFDQDLSGWDVSGVTTMRRMFQDANSFNHDLGNWVIGSITDMSRMLDNSGLSTEYYDATLAGWAAFVDENDNPADITLGAAGLEYCESADARQALIEEFGWTITGDTLSESCQPVALFFTSVAEDASIEEGETFSFQFEAESPEELPLAFQLVDGADTDNATLTSEGLFTFAPEEGQAGTYDFTVRVSDGELHADASFSITVTVFIGPLVRIYVNADGGSDQNPGNSWENAVSNLYKALDIIEEGVTEEIWVAAGTYKPAADFPAYFDTFQLVNGVAIYGGFEGSEEGLEERNWLENPTILSCDLNDSGDFEGNCFHVVTGSGTDETAVLDGFVVTAGQAIAEIDPLENNPYDRGGGLHNTAGSPTISNVIFKNNRGIRGGAVYNGQGSAPILKNVHFIENSAEWGGAMLNRAGSSPTLVNVLFSQNEAENTAGAMYNLENSSPLIINAAFDRNHAETWGGAILNFTDSNPTIVNATFSRNTSFTMGGAMLNNHGSAPIIINSVFWDNKGWTGANEIHNTSTAGVPLISYSLIDRGIDGPGITGEVNDLGGNISSDPWLVDPDNGNVRLTGGSPAIGAGTMQPFLADGLAESIETDLDGDPRFTDDSVSMGAYEWSWKGGSVVFVDQNAIGANDGVDWSSAFTDLQSALRTSEAVGPEVISEVWTAAGTYLPTRDPFDRESSFHLVNGVAVYGGFGGSESSIDERNWSDNETILSGNIDSSDDTDWNSFSVVVASGTDETAVLDGFTITGGNADMSGDYLFGPTRSGAGIFNINGSPTLANLIVQNNIADYGGGGMMNYDGSSPKLTNIIFRNNSGNRAGGLKNRENSSPILNGILFENNTANFGAGMSNAVNSNAVVINTVFLNNTAVNTGAGGVDNIQNSSPLFINCTFFGNLTNGTGGGLRNDGEGSIPELINVIFWGNESTFHGSLSQIHNMESAGLPVLHHSLVQGGVDGPGVTGGVHDNGGNIDSDPLFVDPAEGDLRLNQESGAIQSGTIDPYMAGGPAEGVTTDAAGNSRISGGTVDIGAFENQRATRSSRGRISENNEKKDFGDTGLSLMFTGIPQNVQFDILVDYLETPPKEVSFTGLPPKVHSDFSWIVTPLGGTFESATLYLNDYPDLPGIDDPEDVAIYSRPVPDIGEFSMLDNTEYDIDLDALKVQLSGFSEFIIASIETDVSADHADHEIPMEFTLAQNYPNPFNPSTNITFGLPEQADVRLEVFDIIGRRVTTLVRDELEPGNHTAVFDGGSLSSGMYLYRLQAGEKVLTRKMILVK